MVYNVFTDVMLAMALDMFPLEDRVAYIYSPWEYDLDMQCLTVTYYTFGPSLNTLTVFLQYDDEHLHVRFQRLYFYSSYSSTSVHETYDVNKILTMH